MRDLISIVIPVYNRSNYLVKCLNSIIESNDHSKFEVILVDDGSTDNSGKICDKYATNFSNVHVVHKENTGVSSTRNVGLSIAEGRWIWFIDGDDLPFPGAVDILYNQMIGREDDVVIFAYQSFSKDCSFSKKIDAHRQVISKDDAIGTLLDMNYASFPWNKLFKRRLLLDNEIMFPEDMSMCEDMEFCLRAYDKAKNFALISEPLYGYRQDGSSLSFSTDNKHYKDMAVANYDLCRYIEQKYQKYFGDSFKNAVIAVIAYLHRYDHRDNRYAELSEFISMHEQQCKRLNRRYRIEVITFLHNKRLFYIIGLAGKILRYIRK